jgi:dihydrofolate reductase
MSEEDMKIVHIVAMSRNRVIGNNNNLPWAYTPEEQVRFDSLTAGGTVVMGHTTYQRLGILSGRRNIVLSKTPANIQALYDTPGVEVAQTLDDAINTAKGGLSAHQNVFIVGGSSLYNQTMHIVDTIHLTMVDTEIQGDALYPEVPGFRVVSSSPIVHRKPSIQFMTLSRSPTFK